MSECPAFWSSLLRLFDRRGLMDTGRSSSLRLSGMSPDDVAALGSWRSVKWIS